MIHKILNKAKKFAILFPKTLKMSFPPQSFPPQNAIEYKYIILDV